MERKQGNTRLEGDHTPTQRSSEGDARREVFEHTDRVCRGDVDEVVIRVRRGQGGSVHVFAYD